MQSPWFENFEKQLQQVMNFVALTVEQVVLTEAWRSVQLGKRALPARKYELFGALPFFYLSLMHLIVHPLTFFQRQVQYTQVVYIQGSRLYCYWQRYLSSVQVVEGEKIQGGLQIFCRWGQSGTTLLRQPEL